MTVTVEQRFIDKARTRKLDGYFNVIVDGRYIGTVHKVVNSDGSVQWYYGMMQTDYATTKNAAVKKLVARKA